ncbi:5-formyltetrahydrofolate cyclo-ligase [Shouchella tritolerans]|uniref:5-formyltetrahydrofolate cyclo-ligase n=1 Tax=Shouchella tritolerans TaxID=2979466 RepID=UPI0021E8E289|nr:5-formyltetrahydrofolate cyclo-ligase [Shouchella tritolerans]
MRSKQNIRNDVSKHLNMLPAHVYKQRSTKLANLFMQQDGWKQAKTIALTVSRFPEVETAPLIAAALAENKKVALPRINMKERTMSFFYITSTAELVKNKYGLFEPEPEKSCLARPDELDLIVVPGVAFTKTGKRLGLGGGFYDRFLPNCTGLTVALCFHEQLFSDLPTEPHDFLIDQIISDDRIDAS